MYVKLRHIENIKKTLKLLTISAVRKGNKIGWISRVNSNKFNMCLEIVVLNSRFMAVVTWLKYCRYGVKNHTINQSKKVSKENTKASERRF